MNIKDHAMLASLNLKVWTARKYDKAASDAVATVYSVTTKAGRYNKNLLPQGSKQYEVILTIMGEARNAFYHYTLPWTQDGARILPATAFMDFTDSMNKHEAAFSPAVAQFIQEFPMMVTNAQHNLGTLFKPQDYPADIADRFGFKVSIFPLPDAGDFRVGLNVEEVQDIRDSITANVQEAVKDAMQELYQRLFDTVAHMADCLSDADKIFRDSLVDNLVRVCKVLPKLNLTNDVRLHDLHKEVTQHLLGHSPKDLRTDKVLRKQVADKAVELQKKMQTMMGQ